MPNEHIIEKLAQLPEAPGIYLFYNASGVLVYVGKATSLKSRVRSYFIKVQNSRPIEQMIHEVVDIRWKIMDSVLESIIIESLYIKKYQPKYNVLGKDDKSWNYIVITRDEYPRVDTGREYDLEQLSDEEKKERFAYIFGPYPGLHRRAAMKLLARLFHISFCEPGQKRPCLYYEMGQCLGVCTREISPRDYKRLVITPLVLLLKGQKKRVIQQLEKEMNLRAVAEDFEAAGRLRDQVAALERIQDITLLNESFLRDPDMKKIQQLVHVGRVGKKDSRKTAGEESLRITRIEGYDISNLGVTGKVGSMVVFVHGEPEKRYYRKFRIRSVEGQSDVDCLAEVIERRLNHPEWPLPALFLVDGGKPQLNRVKEIFARRGINVPLIGIAKGPERKRNDIFFAEATPELVHWANANQRLLIRVRDEAHRFAIAYQRNTRRIR